MEFYLKIFNAGANIVDLYISCTAKNRNEVNWLIFSIKSNDFVEYTYKQQDFSVI